MKGKIAENAYSEEKEEIIVNFLKGEKDNPKINAILLVKGSLENTDHETFKAQLEELERQTLEKERVNINLIY
jgi:hypothetical protein